MEVWVPLKMTPHNCVALRDVVAPATEVAEAVDCKAGAAEASAVLDIPSQAIKIGARLVSAMFKFIHSKAYSPLFNVTALVLCASILQTSPLCMYVT